MIDKNLNAQKLDPKFICEAKENGYLHVFFVNSPITTLVTSLIIEKYNLGKDEVVIISVRNTDTSILNYFTINLSTNLIDKIFFKLFNFNLYGKRLLWLLRARHKKFLIYTAWYYQETHCSINSSECIGHIYLEEGQLSYKSVKAISNKEMIEVNKSKLYLEPNLRKNYFLNTAKAYIGIFPDVFPQVLIDQKIILNNHSDLLKFYKPKLIGIKNIGLTCAERRINGKDWRKMIDKLLQNMPNGGVIKLHPSFATSKKINDFKRYTELKSNKKVTICSFDTIVEIEMIKENKNLIGPLTSLKKYALLFGSSFNEIKLY